MTNIKWTDKIQAIAALIAICGGIAGFVTLFTADKETQQQINSLTQIAYEFSNHTEIMREELKILRNRNQILLENLDIDKNKWISLNKPDIELNLNKWKEWSTKKNNLNTINLIKGFTLINCRNWLYRC